MLLDNNRIDPALRGALDAFPTLEITRENLAEVRALFAATRPRSPVPPGVLDTKETISTNDGDLDVYVYRKSKRALQPAVLWIHGGGYILGSAEDDLAMQIAMHCDCTVFSVDYRVAPEHPFPAGPEDCYTALAWIMSGNTGLDLDLNKVAVGGNSAGGGMAAGTVLLNRDRENFPLVFQLLMYPMIDNLHATASGQIENHPVWQRSTSLNAWEMYLDGKPGANASPYAAAARATNLAVLPPAYICVGTEDLFRDEDIEYANRLIQAGVPAELAVFPGVYHSAELLTPEAPVSKRLTQSVMSALADALA